MVFDVMKTKIFSDCLKGLIIGALTLGTGAWVLQATPALKGLVIDENHHEKRQFGEGKAVITHLARGKEAYLGRLMLQGGVHVPLHQDPTEEYLIIEQGHGIIEIDGVSHKLKPGSVVYMPANAKVSFTNDSETFVALQVFAGPESADKYQNWTLIQAP